MQHNSVGQDVILEIHFPTLLEYEATVQFLVEIDKKPSKRLITSIHIRPNINRKFEKNQNQFPLFAVVGSDWTAFNTDNNTLEELKFPT